MHNADQWDLFFDRVFFNLFDRSIVLRRLIQVIRTQVKPPAAIIEIGCGSGLTSVLLSHMGYRVIAIDINRAIISNVKKFESVFANLSFQCMDMMHLEFRNTEFEVAFSQGVLEHYPDSMIVEALREQARIAKLVVVDVPNGRGKLGDYGDERLISNRQWRRLISRAGLAVSTETSRGMSRWSQWSQSFFGWVEESWLSACLGENSIFVARV